MSIVDVLMVTHRTPEYVRLSLPRLLASGDERMRVWLWHNGSDIETLGIVHAHLDHPRVANFHHSPQNVGLVEPTNWVWRDGDGTYVAKVDDDGLVPVGWLTTLTSAHDANARFGAIATWRFQPEDFVPELARPKLHTFEGGHTLLRNPWVQGSGYVMKRRCIDDLGLLRTGQEFPVFLNRLARRGWINGWYYPFVREEHMDDPRSLHSLLRSDADLARRAPRSARLAGIDTLEAWQAHFVHSAQRVQEAPLEPRAFESPWRKVTRRLRRAVGRDHHG